MSDESGGGLPSFAVIVPMFNERAGAERCVREIVKVLAVLPNRTSLVVVNDGSKDGTEALLGALAPGTPLLDIVTHPVNRGYGAALVTGAARAADQQFEYGLFMDSDLTNDPRDIPRFAEKMREGADVIKATRYSSGGSVAGVPFYRVAVSAVGNRLARFLLGVRIHDCTNGYRAVRCAVLQKMTLRENGFAIIMEELYWCTFLGSRFDEVPVVLTNRTGDQRPTSFTYRPGIFWRYLKYPLRSFFGQRPEGPASREV